MTVSGLKSLRHIMRHQRRMHVLLVLLLAGFVFQTSILRAHVHTGGTVHELATDATGGAPTKPAHNETDCPLWHASSVCGAALNAEVATAVAPLSLTSERSRDERNVVPERFAVTWRSRAPPTL